MKHLGPLLLLLFAACAGPAAWAQPCCGPITAEGQRLAALLDGTGVAAKRNAVAEFSAEPPSAGRGQVPADHRLLVGLNITRNIEYRAEH